MVHVIANRVQIFQDCHHWFLLKEIGVVRLVGLKDLNIFTTYITFPSFWEKKIVKRFLKKDQTYEYMFQTSYLLQKIIILHDSFISSNLLMDR